MTDTKTKYDSWDKNELIKEIQKFQKRKKYGLVWDENHAKEKFEIEIQNKLPILKEITNNNINNTSKITNILIEGDNYHSLSVLNYTHKNKIDMIYIDPPYNTGKNKEWKYNDQYIDKNDDYKHSKWLTFMSVRLKLAKKLLKANGLICISIDDNEFAQLKLLCDEIFGEKNKIVIFSRITKKGGSKGQFYSPGVDYVLIYAYNIDNVRSFKEPITDEYISKYNKEDTLGKYVEKGLDENDFGDASKLVNLHSIPAAILNIYKKIFPFVERSNK